MRKADLKKMAFDWCERLLTDPKSPPPSLEGVNDTVDNNNAIKGYAATALIDAGYEKETVFSVVFKEKMKHGH